MDTPSTRFKRRAMIDVELDNFQVQKRYISEKMAQELGYLSISPPNERNMNKREIVNPFLRSSSHRSAQHCKNASENEDSEEDAVNSVQKMIFNFGYNDDEDKSVVYSPLCLPKKEKKRDKKSRTACSSSSSAYISRELMYSLPPKSILRTKIPVDIPRPFTDWCISKAMILYKSPSEVILRSLENNKTLRTKELAKEEEANAMLVDGDTIVATKAVDMDVACTDSMLAS